MKGFFFSTKTGTVNNDLGSENTVSPALFSVLTILVFTFFFSSLKDTLVVNGSQSQGRPEIFRAPPQMPEAGPLRLQTKANFQLKSTFSIMKSLKLISLSL